MTPPHDTSPPTCPYCLKPKVLRTWRSANRIDFEQKWRCENPSCPRSTIERLGVSEKIHYTTQERE